MRAKILYTTLLIFMFFQTLNMNVLPFYILNISQNPNVYSFAFSLFSFGMFFGSFILGSFADKFGRKITIVALIPLYGLLQLLTPLIETIQTLYIIRFASGFLLAGVVANTTPLIMENIKQNTEKVIGNFTVFGSVLISIGTFTGGILAQFISHEAPLIFQFVLSIIISIFLYFNIYETHDKSEPKAYKDNKTSATKKPNNQSRERKILSFSQICIMLINSIYILIFFFALQGGRLLLITYYSFDPARLSYMSLYTGLLGLLIGSLFYPKMLKFLNKKHILYTAFILLLFGVLSIGIYNSIFSMIILFTFAISPQNLVKVPMNTLLAENIKSNKGFIFGVNNASISLFTALGSMIVGFMFNLFGTYSFIFMVFLILILFVLT
ncbi:MAG: MFS transporter, partial [Defluviitaleaceae bacterium]|nr:MFS transporter [Defluviitaleaceae bacterium]